MATVETSAKIENGKLPAALRAAVAFAPKKFSKPILCGVNVRAQSDGITVSATNLELGFSATLPTNENNVETNIVIPRAAAELWAKTSAECIDVSGCSAAAGGVSAPVEDGLEFPAIDYPENPSAVVSIPFHVFKAIAEHIGSATDDGSSRYALGGIYLDGRSDGRGFRAVGTDGRRLHVAQIPAAVVGELRHVVPAYAFSAAVKAVEKTIDTRGREKRAALDSLRVVIALNDSTGVGCFGWAVGNCNFSVSWRRIDGRFPRYADVFPDIFGNRSADGHLVAADIIRHAETCRKTVCSEQSKGIDVFRETLSDSATISAQSAERGVYRHHLAGYLPVGFRRKLDPVFVSEAVAAAVAFQGIDGRPVDSVELWSDGLGVNMEERGKPVYLGNPADIFAAVGWVTFAAVICPLAAD